MFDHVMLDIETLDNTKTAVIVSIGAVRFDLDRLELGDEFYAPVTAESCRKVGLTEGESTLAWWAKQSEAARLVLSDPMARTIQDALTDFSSFVSKFYDTKVWGMGSTFDNVIVQNAYQACGMKCPWSYRNDMCFRTMLKMFPQPYCSDGVAHNALDDARRQAKTLIEIWRQLKQGPK